MVQAEKERNHAVRPAKQARTETEPVLVQEPVSSVLQAWEASVSVLIETGRTPGVHSVRVTAAVYFLACDQTWKEEPQPERLVEVLQALPAAKERASVHLEAVRTALGQSALSDDQEANSPERFPDSPAVSMQAKKDASDSSER